MLKIAQWCSAPGSFVPGVFLMWGYGFVWLRPRAAASGMVKRVHRCYGA
jgi:hypothetical protein